MVILDEVVLDGERTALVVIDVVKDFCVDGFAYSKRGWDTSAIRNMVHESLLAFIARSIGKTRVVFVKSSYAPREFENDKHPIEDLCLEGSEGAQFYMLNQNDADITYSKRHWSAFFEPRSKVPSELDRRFREWSLKNLIVTGLTFTHCIPYNIDDGLELGYKIVLPRDCVASRAERIDAHTENMDRYEASSVIVTNSAGIKYR